MSDNTETDALRIADFIDFPNVHYGHEAAAELRRLHEAHDWQYKMAGERLRRIEKLEALNAELVGALRIVVDSDDRAAKQQARAALAKVGESK